MKPFRSERGGWWRVLLALTACALIAQSVLFGAAGPKTPFQRSVAQHAAHQTAPHDPASHVQRASDRHASAAHHQAPGGPEKPSDAPPHNALCALICALRAVASGPAVLPSTALPARPSSVPVQPALPVLAFLPPSRSPLPVGARGPPARFDRS